MAARPKIFDDIAGMAGGAFSALSGLGEEIEQLVRARVDEALQRLKLVRRDEFDAVAELAANARAGGEDAEARIAALEARVAALEGAAPRGLGGAGSMGGASAPVADEAVAASPGTADPHLDAEGGLGGPPPLAHD